MPHVSLTISGKDPQPYGFQLDQDIITIGRSPNNDIVVDCPSISSKHCTMERVSGGYILRDQNSTNGITLDEEQMTIIDLRNGSHIHIGHTEFAFNLSDEELAELNEEDFLPHAQKAAKNQDSPSRKKRKKTQKKGKKNADSSGSARPGQIVQPVLSPSTQGVGFFYTLCLLVCGLGALCAGLNNSYANKQKIAGREGEISLFKDIKDGRPPLPKEKEE